MAANIAALLDKAKVMHRLSSDYKLALVLSVDQKSLRNYRQGITMPDARVISLICGLTGDDPALLAVQIEEQRAKTDEAKALWHQIAARLQSAAAAGVFSVLFLVGGLGGFSNDAHAAFKPVSQLHFLYIVEHAARRLARLFRALLAPAVRYLRGLITRGNHVSGTASTAAA